MIDHCSYTTLAVVKLKPEKIQVLNSGFNFTSCVYNCDDQS